jgi:hypothetical protein
MYIYTYYTSNIDCEVSSSGIQNHKSLPKNEQVKKKLLNLLKCKTLKKPLKY